MDPSGLIPSPDSIPVPWGWFKFLLLLTFVLHLIMMNFMLGGSLIGFYRRLRGRAPAPESGSIPTLIALTVNLGVPPLLFVQVLFGQFLYTSSIIMAIFWLTVIPVLIIAYYAAYGFVGKMSRPSGSMTLWMGVSALLLLLVSFIYTNNMTLMLRPERWTAYFQDPGGGFLNLSEPTLIPRWLHFVVASVAVAGLGASVFYKVREIRGGESHGGEIRSGLRLFGWATLLQMAIGVIFWLTLPQNISQRFLGSDPMFTGHLWLGVLVGAVAVHFAFRGNVWMTSILAFVTIATMVMVRDLVRTAYLEPYFSPADLQVVPQISPMLVFFACLLAVAAIMIWMIRQAWNAKA